MTAAIEATSLHFAYGRRTVIEDVDFRAEPGEVVGIIGPNGAGKSTLLRLLGGAHRPLRGDVRIDGRHVTDYDRAELARKIATVSQEAAVDFPFSVTEVVLMGRAPHLGGRMFESERDLRVAERAMQQTGVRHLADRLLHELSGGERQRVVLARALAQETPILLLDEPTVFLDIRHQIEIYELLRDLSRRGYTVVTAQHDLNLAAMYCQRLVLLCAGRALCSGRPEEVLTVEHLRAAYGTEVRVRRDDALGALTVSPLPRRHGAHDAA